MENTKKYNYKTVIQININNFTFEGNSKIKEEYSLRNEEVIGLYDKELHLEKLRLSELKEAREKGIEQGIEEIQVV